MSNNTLSVDVVCQTEVGPLYAIEVARKRKLSGNWQIGYKNGELTITFTAPGFDANWAEKATQLQQEVAQIERNLSMLALSPAELAILSGELTPSGDTVPNCS